MIFLRIGDRLLRLSQRLDRPGYPWYCWTIDTVAGWFNRIGYRWEKGYSLR